MRSSTVERTSPEGTSPHAPLPQYYRDESQRAPWVRGVFDRTAIDYDRIERLMAFGTGPWYRRQALLRAGLAPGMQVLDVGTGTGLTAREAIEIVGDAARVIGIDPSPGMLAASTVPAASPRIVGSGEALPIADNSVDFLSMGFALRHVADVDAVFTEYFRVLRPGGRLCILEITRPQQRTHFLALRFYLRGVVPLLARAFGRSTEMPELMRYYWDTIEACVPPPVVIARLQHAGFLEIDRHVEADMFSEYRARKPGGAG